MSDITVIEHPNTTQYTTLAKVEEEVSGSAKHSDDYLNRLIDESSALLDSATRRTFAREHITEKLVGTGRVDMTLRNFPIQEVTEVRHDGNKIDVSEYEIKNGSAGILFRESGWTNTFRSTQYVGVIPLATEREPLWEVDYIYGYLLPGDDISGSTTISADSTNDKFKSSADEFPLLVKGDRIDVSGFNDSSINGKYTVDSRTKSEITVQESIPADESAGNSINIVVRDLPHELERLVLDEVVAQENLKGQPQNLIREQIGDTSNTYQGQRNIGSGSVMLSSPILAKWKRFF